MDAFITALIIGTAIFTAVILASMVYTFWLGYGSLWFVKDNLSDIDDEDDNSSEDRIEAIKTEARELTNH